MTDHPQADRPRSAETARAQEIRDRWEKFQSDYFSTPPAEISQLAADGMIVAIDARAQLRAAQEEADKLRMFLGDASPKSNALRQRVDAERAADKARITELESALRTAQSWIDAAVKSCASRGCSQKEYEAARVQRERAEQAESRITELESALQARASSSPTLADVLAVVQRWHDVYPLDVFPADGESRDCHSAAMGRHMSLRLQEEIRKLWTEAETAATTGPDEPLPDDV